MVDLPAGFRVVQQGMPKDPSGNAIDLNRPRIENNDGSFSTERTIGIEADGKFFNIPTIMNGKQLTEDEAVDAFMRGVNKPVGVFASQAEADAAASARSSRIGEVRGNLSIPDGFRVVQQDQAATAQPDQFHDIVASGSSGIARGAADLVGLPGTIGDAMNSGGKWLLKKGYGLATGAEPSTEGGAVERFFAGPKPEIEKAMIGGGSNPLGGTNLKAGLSGVTGGATDYQPYTTAGKYARTAGEFLPGAAAFGGASLSNLVRMGLVPATTSEAAGQLTEGTAFEPYARLGGALVGGAIGGSAFPSKAAKLPTAAEIKASAGYKDLKPVMQAARIGKDEYSGIVKGLIDDAKDFGIVKTEHGGILSTLKDHARVAGKQGASMQDLEIMRRELANAGKNFTNPSAQALSGRLIDKLDESVNNIGNAGIKTPNGQTIEDAIAALKEARGVYRTGMKSQIVEGAIDRAQNVASGVENGLRIEFRKLLNNQKLARQFTEVERQAIKQVVKGNFSSNTMRWLGSFGLPIDQGRGAMGSLMGGGVGATVGSALGGPIGAAVGAPLLMGIGTAAKVGSNAATRNQASLVEALVKAGPQAGKMFESALSARSLAGKEGLLRALLQGQSAVQTPSAKQYAPR